MNRTYPSIPARNRPSAWTRLLVLALTGDDLRRDALAAQPATDRGTQPRCHRCGGSPQPKPHRRHQDLRAVLLDRPHDRLGDVLRRAGADAYRQLDPRVGKHAGIANEPWDHHRHPDAGVAEVLT